jgi:hypothetical protein
MKRFFVIVLLVAAVYIGTYIWLRTSHVERWDRDGNNYVILPESGFVYYVYRPLTIIDAHLTGMRFHTGPYSLAIFARASNQSMKPTQHFGVSSGQMRTPIFKVLGGSASSRPAHLPHEHRIRHC